MERDPAFERFSDPTLAAAPHALPALPPEQLSALKRSIAAEGVLLPIVRSAGPACTGEIADGRIREAICRELGLACPVELRAFSTESDLLYFRYTTNVRRRHLPVAERIRLAAQLEPLERERAARRRAQAAGKPRGEKALPVNRAEEKGETSARLAELAGVSRATYTRGSKVLHEGSPKLVEAFLTGKESAYGAHRKLRSEQRRAERDEIARRIELDPPGSPSGCFYVVVIDPPWPYEDLPYPTMTLEQIAAIPVPDLLEQNAVVWLWTTNRFMYDSIRIARECWGLEQRNIVTWVKDRFVTGKWLQGQTEHCLLLTRGKPVHRFEGRSTLLEGKVREHSRKPEEFYELVEATCPGSKLELFAREKRPGWEAWGAETDRFPGPETEREEA